MLGIGCSDCHALPRITTSMTHRPRQVLPSRASGFVLRPTADLRASLARHARLRRPYAYAADSSAQRGPEGDIAALDKRVVEPTRLRSGGGRALFDWPKNTARQARVPTLLIESDPHPSAPHRSIGALEDAAPPSGQIPTN